MRKLDAQDSARMSGTAQLCQTADANPVKLLDSDSVSVMDKKPANKAKPKRQAGGSRYANGFFVSVAQVAKEWDVTPRRIRALLAEGRLVGSLAPDNTWQVKFPYSFTFGLRGPSLKRERRPARRRKVAEGVTA